MERTHSCSLGPVQRYRLEQAVAPINEAFDAMSYLVGSCLQLSDYRDVDVRLILDVDFQIQAMTSANAKEPGERHALFVSRAREAMP